MPRFIVLSCGRNKADAAPGNAWESVKIELDGFVSATQEAAADQARILAASKHERSFFTAQVTDQYQLPALTPELVQTKTIV